MTKYILTMLLLLTILLSNCGPKQKVNNDYQTAVGGACYKCELMYDGMPRFEKIDWVTNIAPPNEPGQKIEINGTVFLEDGYTPARNVTLYIYHTDARGVFSTIPGQKFGKYHGHLRGWVRTDDEGQFRFYSIKPGPYPFKKVPAHIAILVKEPRKTIYYIDDIRFDDDRLLTQKLKNNAPKRGGNLVIHLAKSKDGILRGKVTIILGLNIPNYKSFGDNSTE